MIPTISPLLSRLPNPLASSSYDDSRNGCIAREARCTENVTVEVFWGARAFSVLGSPQDNMKQENSPNVNNAGFVGGYSGH